MPYFVLTAFFPLDNHFCLQAWLLNVFQAVFTTYSFDLSSEWGPSYSLFYSHPLLMFARFQRGFIWCYKTWHGETHWGQRVRVWSGFGQIQITHKKSITLFGKTPEKLSRHVSIHAFKLQTCLRLNLACFMWQTGLDLRVWIKLNEFCNTGFFLWPLSPFLLFGQLWDPLVHLFWEVPCQVPM